MTHFTILNLRPFDQDNTTYIGVYNDNDTVNPNGIIEKIADNKVMEADVNFSLHNEYNKLKSHYSHISALGFEDHTSLQEYMEEISATKKKPIVLKLYRETEDYLVFNNDITYGKEQEPKVSESFHNDHPITKPSFSLLNGLINVLENSSKNDTNDVLDHFNDFLTGALGQVDKNTEKSEEYADKESYSEKVEKENTSNNTNTYDSQKDDYYMSNGIFKDFPIASNDSLQDFIQDFVNGINNESIEETEQLNNPFDPKYFLSDNNMESQKSKTVDRDVVKEYFDKVEAVEKEFSVKQEKLEQEKKIALDNVKKEFFKNM